MNKALLSKLYAMHKIKKKKLRWYKVPKQQDPDKTKQLMTEEKEFAVAFEANEREKMRLALTEIIVQRESTITELCVVISDTRTEANTLVSEVARLEGEKQRTETRCAALEAELAAARTDAAGHKKTAEEEKARRVEAQAAASDAEALQKRLEVLRQKHDEQSDALAAARTKLSDAVAESSTAGSAFTSSSFSIVVVVVGKKKILLKNLPFQNRRAARAAEDLDRFSFKHCAFYNSRETHVAPVTFLAMHRFSRVTFILHIFRAHAWITSNLLVLIHLYAIHRCVS